MQQEEIKNTCFNCKVVECFRLFDYSEDNDNIGHDLYFGQLFYKKIHEENDENLKYTICINNRLFKFLCFFMDAIPETERNNLLRKNLLNSVKDLKSSIFLALTGNYRNAMQVLRCSFETILYALYFHTDFIQSINLDEEKEVTKKYKSWISGGFQKRIDVMNEVYRRSRLITRKEEKEWNKLYNNLSKFIHTPRAALTKNGEMEIDSAIHNCIAYNVFSISDLELWSEYFLKVYYILMKIGLYFEPSIKENDNGKKAMMRIKEVITKKMKFKGDGLDESDILLKIQKLI